VSDFCEAHWERQAIKVPVFRVGLCADCFKGKPIRLFETVETAPEPRAPVLVVPLVVNKRRIPERYSVLRPPEDEQLNGRYLNIGHALKFCRVALDVTQYQLADRMAVPRPWVSKVENGVFNPSIEHIERIAAALGLPTWFFVTLCEIRLYESSTFQQANTL
jgi:DNA-binding XRE family transcriptional regulator